MIGRRLARAWAQARRGKATDEAVRRQAASDVHAPYAFRVDGTMGNIDAWYRAFSVKPGDRRYLAPRDRVRIW